jgi:8-oxo-dGTP diphosphatase
MPYVYDHPHPAVACDVALFTRRAGALFLLLIQRGGEPFRGRWALPGGFIEEREDLDSCARRELKEETGLEAKELLHFANFSDPDRDPRERVISVAYLALLPESAATAKAGSDAASLAWHAVDALPPLAFDHAEIIAAALVALRRRGPLLEP